MGWYDANPSDLNDLPLEPAAKKYVEYMGGEDAVLEKAQADFDKGEYRWVATALKHVVFANPDSQAGKEPARRHLRAARLSGRVRTVALGVPARRVRAAQRGSERRRHQEREPRHHPGYAARHLFDYFAVRLNGPNAAGKNLTLNVNFTDLNKEYGLTVENAVLNYSPEPVPNANARISLAKSTLDQIQLGDMTIDEATASGDMVIDGQRESFNDFIGLLDTYNFWFNIVTP